MLFRSAWPGCEAVAKLGGFTPPPPQLSLPEGLWRVLPGVFIGGGLVGIQLKKVAIGVYATCFASDNSDSETNGQGAVTIIRPSNPGSVICHNHLSFSVEAVL